MYTQLEPAFFKHNRTRTMELLEGGVLVASAYAAMQRNYDAAFKFEQEANFYYLTGIERADWWLLLDSSRDVSYLVSPEVDPVHALFDGQLTPRQAQEMSGITAVISRAEADEMLADLARSHQRVYTIDQPARAGSFGFVLNPAARQLRQKLEDVFARVEDARPILAKLRAIKQSPEIAMIETAIDMTIRTLEDVKSEFSHYQYEYQIEADITRGFRASGAAGHAYDPIVASAANACTLHYVENNATLVNGSLVLLDVGAQVSRYAADITRTYAYGELSPRQREVYAAVRAAHSDIIALLEPGLDVETYSQKVDRRMQKALLELGLIGSLDDEKYRTYFPHAISHGLGLDVHDSLGAPDAFATGMVLTVEPGIYIPEENIGVRIEDDILITGEGHRNLSARLPTMV